MFNNIPPITRNIIILNVIVFIVTLIMPQLYETLSGFYPFSPNFKSWQIITHMFMHGGYMHILFNMFTLFSFGPVLEQALGEKKYLILYFVSGLGAFFLFNLWNFIEVQQIVSGLESLGLNASELYSKSVIGYSGNMNISATTTEGKELSQQLYDVLRTPMVGASGAIFGVVAAFATLYPNAKIGIMFIPIPMKVKYVLPVVVIGSIYLGVSGNGGGIAHLAHVGGAIVGFILARIWRKHLYRFN
ncbi:membrane associated rhomboid family serine protease [Chryseobacterium ginsenosidimutans]|uniref:rhomboid family intramembrane serine protease n=1 Tax=Chryseobacterium ginsenosidimutans TaxID=687846 RepID=UPI002169CF45|nr:rhomboid family intramembrane serine protease [Chryseobacterium ginsenosidimutans]MCS3867534.1 membrane associated rhomboid family serine protease [Chryseobacterium ginsenosidimutans]